jgi:hypothetical protein
MDSSHHFHLFVFHRGDYSMKLRPFNPTLLNQGDFVAVYSETREDWLIHRFVCMFRSAGVVIETTQGEFIRFPRGYVLCVDPEEIHPQSVDFSDVPFITDDEAKQRLIDADHPPHKEDV